MVLESEFFAGLIVSALLSAVLVLVDCHLAYVSCDFIIIIVVVIVIVVVVVTEHTSIQFA